MFYDLEPEPHQLKCPKLILIWLNESAGLSYASMQDWRLLHCSSNSGSMCKCMYPHENMHALTIVYEGLHASMHAQKKLLIMVKGQVMPNLSAFAMTNASKAHFG